MAEPLAPVADPALVAHRPLAVAAVDVQRRGRLVQAGDGAARAQLDDLVGHVPQLESLQQVDVGHVPVFLKNGHALIRVSGCGDVGNLRHVENFEAGRNGDKHQEMCEINVKLKEKSP